MKLCMVVGCLVVAPCGPGPAIAERTVVIRAGHLVDTDSGRVLDAQTIVVRDGIIEDVGQKIAVPAGARTVDLRSRPGSRSLSAPISGSARSAATRGSSTSW